MLKQPNKNNNDNIVHNSAPVKNKAIVHFDIESNKNNLIKSKNNYHTTSKNTSNSSNNYPSNNDYGNNIDEHIKKVQLLPSPASPSLKS